MVLGQHSKNKNPKNQADKKAGTINKRSLLVLTWFHVSTLILFGIYILIMVYIGYFLKYSFISQFEMVVKCLLLLLIFAFVWEALTYAFGRVVVYRSFGLFAMLILSTIPVWFCYDHPTVYAMLIFYTLFATIFLLFEYFILNGGKFISIFMGNKINIDIEKNIRMYQLPPTFIKENHEYVTTKMLRNYLPWKIYQWYYHENGILLVYAHWCTLLFFSDKVLSVLPFRKNGRVIDDKGCESISNSISFMLTNIFNFSTVTLQKSLVTNEIGPAFEKYKKSIVNISYIWKNWKKCMMYMVIFFGFALVFILFFIFNKPILDYITATRLEILIPTVGSGIFIIYMTYKFALFLKDKFFQKTTKE